MNSFDKYIANWKPLINAPSYKVRYNLTLTFDKFNKGIRVKQFDFQTDFSNYKWRRDGGIPREWEEEGAKYI